mgnify:CR=1 FL=1
MAFRREKKRIGDMLINENVITQEQLEKALPIAKEKHKKIGETLIELGFTNELEIAKALSQQLGLEQSTYLRRCKTLSVRQCLESML